MKHSAGIANQSSFSSVNSPAPQRSVIPISATRKTTMDTGFLIPIFHKFMLPGDVISAQVTMFARLLTLKFPLMDNLILDWFVFYEPERLLWSNFEKMQGYQEDPGDSTDFVFPWLSLTPGPIVFVEHTPADYFGLPVDVGIDPDIWHIRSGPFRMYRDVWNNWFRDQNYQASLTVSRGDGPDDADEYNALLRRNKRPDYFSSALPTAQKGPDVPIPWQGDAPVYGDGSPISWKYDNLSEFSTLNSTIATGSAVFATPPSVTATAALGEFGEQSGNYSSHIVADISAVSATINQLRESIVLQQIYELDMRGGTRYTEALKNRWNVDAEDFRLQRPEYVGGGSSSFSVSQVAQSSPTVGDDAMASLSAYSELRMIDSFSYTCVEHGHLMILLNVRAPLTYQQQLGRIWLSASRFDLPEPLTMNLGERPVFNYELFYTPTTDPLLVWGFQEIWAEYRYDNSFVSGKFRSIVAGTLDSWHLALKYTADPVHNGDWVMDDPPVERVVAFEEQPEIKMDFLIKGKIARQMPVVSIPGLMRF